MIPRRCNCLHYHFNVKLQQVCGLRLMFWQAFIRHSQTGSNHHVTAHESAFSGPRFRLSYRRVREGYSWISDYFSIQVLEASPAEGNEELPMLLVQNRKFKVHSRCRWFSSASGSLCPTAKKVSTEYFMIMDIYGKISYIPQTSLLRTSESRTC